MKNFKKMKAVVLAAVLSCSLAVTVGCGKGKSQEETTMAQTTAQVTTVATTTESTISKTSKEGQAAPSVNGKLHTEGTKLVGEDGSPVQLNGLSTHGIAWFPDYINADLFKEFHEEWNASVIRLAMYTAESGGYCTGGNQNKLKEMVKNGVKYATDNDMYVIVDWHILSDNNPQLHKDEAKAFFDEMSREFAANKNVLYEICNEPNGGTQWSDVKSYAEEVIPVIRANSPDALVLVGSPTWSQDVDKAAADPIALDNVAYTLHYYAATHKTDLQNKMKKAIDAGLPIFVSEYGICDASGNGAIDEASADTWMSLLDEYGISSCLWNISNKAESSSIFKAGVSKKSGFTDEDLSQSGIWIKKRLTGDKTVFYKEGSPSSDSPANGTSSGTNSQASSAGTVKAGETDGMKYALVEDSSWEEDGKKCVLYRMTVTNGTGQAVNGWTVEIPFAGGFEMQNGWNATFAPAGDKLKVSDCGWNGQLAGGASTNANDIGFVIKGGN